MITDGALRLVVSLLGVFFGALPDFDLPSWLTGTGGGTLRGYASSAGDGVATVGGWLPGALVGQVVAACVLCSMIALGLALVRRLVLFIRGGG